MPLCTQRGDQERCWPCRVSRCLLAASSATCCCVRASGQQIDWWRKAHRVGFSAGAGAQMFDWSDASRIFACCGDPMPL